MNTTPEQDRRIEATYHTGRFVIDHLVRLYQKFDGDLVAAIVLGTVAQHNLQRYYDEIARRSDEGLDGLVERGAHLPHLRPCNALSVSAATGVPRETVRRKVRWLEDRGWMTVGVRGELSVARHVARQFADFDRETARRLDDCLQALDKVRERAKGAGRGAGR